MAFAPPARRVAAAAPPTALTSPWGPPLIIVLGAVLPLIVAMQRGTGERDVAFGLQLLLAGYAGTRLAVIVVLGVVQPIVGTFWLFTYTAMGLAPLAQLVLAQFPTPFSGSRAHLTTAVLLVLAGCVAFDVCGTMAARHLRGGPAQPSLTGRGTAGPAVPVPPVRADRPPVAGDPPLDLRRYRVLIAASAASLLLSLVLVRRLGGLAVLFSSRQAVTESIGAAGLASADSQVGSALLRGGGTVPVLVMFLALTRVFLTTPAARRSVVLRLTWVALLGANLTVNNPISNPRYWALTVLLSTMFVLVGNRTTPFRWMLVGGLLAAIVVFPYSDRFRYDEAGQRPVQSESLLETLALKDFDQTVMVGNTVAYTDVGEGMRGGGQVAGAVLFFVPRSLWNDKPFDTGVVLGEWLGTNNTNLSAPLWAELWIDFGLAGVVLGFGALGVLVAWGDTRYLSGVAPGSRASRPVSILVPVVAGYAFIVLRGSLLQSMGRLAILALMGVVLAVWDRQMRAGTED